jgi:hypothetical protein
MMGRASSVVRPFSIYEDTSRSGSSRPVLPRLKEIPKKASRGRHLNAPSIMPLRDDLAADKTWRTMRQPTHCAG